MLHREVSKKSGRTGVNLVYRPVNIKKLHNYRTPKKLFLPTAVSHYIIKKSPLIDLARHENALRQVKVPCEIGKELKKSFCLSFPQNKCSIIKQLFVFEFNTNLPDLEGLL